MPNPRPSSNRTAEAPLLKYKTRRKSKSSCLLKCCLIITLVLVILLLLAFIIVFVVLPLIFKYSVELQRGLVFPIDDLYPEDSDYSNFTKYNITGVRNLYVNVNKLENISVGIWHILPEALTNNSIRNEDYEFIKMLANSNYPVVLYFHGNGANRIGYINMYRVLRIFFHVISFDYRGYGDSTSGELTELSVVQDAVQLYKWLMSQTNADIYLWGHSLGSSLSTHVVAELQIENIIPVGLILESPFSSLKDEANYVISRFWFTKMLTWVPWYKITLLDPFEDNGLAFKTDQYIRKVECPIMILHAEDDSLIPYSQGEKLFKVATEMRNFTLQGNATFHLIPSSYGVDHWEMYSLPQLPMYIRNHIEICEEFKNERSKN